MHGTVWGGQKKSQNKIFSGGENVQGAWCLGSVADGSQRGRIAEAEAERYHEIQEGGEPPKLAGLLIATQLCCTCPFSNLFSHCILLFSM